jgi:lipopolysaccharide export system permease protein
MLLNYIAKQLVNLVGKGLSWRVIAEFFLLSLPFTVAMTLPMAILVAVLHAFSRLAAENEITAMKANGISIRRLMLPVLAWSAVFAAGMIAFNDQLLPLTNHRLRTLQGDIARKKPSFALREQIINEVSPGQFFLRTTHLDPATNKMRDVTIYDLSDQLRRHTIYADSGTMALAENGSDLKLTLYHGLIQEVPREEPEKMQRLYYEIDQIRVKGVANAFERDSSDTYKSDREMSVCELQDEVARYERDFFRARDRYDRAAAVSKKNPNGMIAVTGPVIPEANPGPLRAQVRTLGRTYCDVVRTAVPWIQQRLEQLAAAVTPASAYAAQSRQDSAKAKLDSIRYVDSLRMVDSMRAAAGLPPRSAGTAVAQPLPEPLAGDSVVVAAPPPIAPSMGVAPTVPVAVEMEAARAEMVRWRAQINQFAVEIHKKFAISTACVVFVLLGAPLALRFPRGGVGLVIGVSLVVFALYYVGLIAGESLADRNILGPAAAMWAANALFTVAGVALVARMEREGGTARGSDPSEWMGGLRRFARRLTFRSRSS